MDENTTASAPATGPDVSTSAGHVTMNVTFDLRDVLEAATGRRYDPDDDEEYLTGNLSQELLERAAKRIADEHMYQLRSEISGAVQAVVKDRVTAAFTSGEPIVTDRGTATLHELVLKAAREWPTQTADYDRTTNLRKAIKDEVDKAFRGELAKAVEQAKAEMLATFQAKASELILAAAADLNKRTGGR